MRFNCLKEKKKRNVCVCLKIKSNLKIQDANHKFYQPNIKLTAKKIVLNEV